MSSSIVIVGAGQAGAWAAIGLRQAGFDGRILLVGDEPDRPYERPPLSKAMLVDADEPPLRHFHTAERYADADVTLMLGHGVAGIDRDKARLQLADGTQLAYDKLLLATGGTARRLAIPGAEHALYLRTAAEARHLRAVLERAGKVLCIGAGVIGLEVAAAARKRGAEVTVIEPAAAPMLRALSAAGSAFLVALHRDAGVDLRFGERPLEIGRLAQGGFVVSCASGEAISCDVVVAGIGMVRNDAIAAEAGLVTDDGICVDASGRSSDPAIFAAGDVAAFLHPAYERRIRLETWRHAQDHGLAVGKAMAGADEVYDGIPSFWTEQHGVNLQVLGFPTEAARHILRPQADGKSLTELHLAESGAVIAASVAGNPRDFRAATALVRSGVVIAPERLADPALPLQALATGKA
ncbi:FAD-dependent oxidoreductase [Bosea sp. BK604]|uniref:NAD(P)/FAD-dependent oxidoreductase n=1 Tax=Bosea sp. BK604 TaxID=2512180 RepID=UPI00104CE454|nr:FAD-dependent oxidoreductase [Bosea sp. BK604]TCR63164.1 3-phenylpropionate/trans-cinnamate dioxygenase ferredoxin reductase subunit [Bosea sp. BK604]